MKEQWGPLVDTTGDREAFEKKFGKPTRENVWEFLTFDLENSNSIVSCLRSARENARSIREIIPSEMWEELNQGVFDRSAEPTPRPPSTIRTVSWDR